jgi:hypothetical protein
MTSTTPMQRSRLLPIPQRWNGAIVGLLIGVAAVCHGCHGGDRDDELSLTAGKPRVEYRREEPPPTKLTADTLIVIPTRSASEAFDRLPR